MKTSSDLSSTQPDLDRRFMRLALCHARKGLGKTSPNPAVGAVLVRGGSLLATGWHRRAGGPHAEIEALSALPRLESAAGATLYATLEPCSTIGRTPPCTDAIIAAKIGRVVVGAIDANPKHQGRGLERLRRAGIAITTGILEEECGLLNVGFNKWIITGMPWVIAKVAQSVDGRITRPAGEPQWLSNNRSLRLVHYLRASVDAILVGAETVRRDNPRLTIRPSRPGLQPWRVVVTRSGNLPKDATILTDEHRDRTLVYQGVSWLDTFKDLGARGATRLLVEGGADVLGQLHDLQLIDELWCFTTPLLTGGNKSSFGGAGVERMQDASRLHRLRYKRVGNDVLVTGHLLRRERILPGSPP
jgi:diaminohydroxyphosphoribosylaminopyrimidine deaminase / 5-amino-6-(5-phosphoribosylamino)uracil reductase